MILEKKVTHFINYTFHFNVLRGKWIIFKKSITMLSGNPVVDLQDLKKVGGGWEEEDCSKQIRQIITVFLYIKIN